MSTSLWSDLTTVARAGGPESRRYLIASGVLMVLTSVLDAIGVGAIIPFVALVSLPDLFVRYPGLREWLPQALQDNRSHLIFAGTAIFALIFALRAASTLAGAWLQAVLQGTLSLHLSDQMYSGYLRREYAFHLEKGPSYFSARLGDALFKTRTAVQSVQQLGVESLTGLLIVAIVIAANPFAALVSLLGMGLPSVLVYRYLHHRLQRLGTSQHHNWERGMQLIYTGIGAIKDIRIFGRERYFLEAFVAQKREERALTSEAALFSNAPRVLIEFAAVMAVLLLCVALTWQGRLDELVMVMGLYAAAAFRLMPCANRILMALTQIRHSRFGLALVAQDIRDHATAAATQNLEATTKPMPFATLDLDQVVFRYRDDLPPALNDVSLHITAGESVGFVGASGAGKSSLIDVLLGLLAPESGRILVNGEPLEQVLGAWRRRVGYVPQAIYLIDDSIRRNIAFGLDDAEIDDAQVWRVLELARLKEFVASLPEGLDTAVGERGVKLSGGQRQRVGIARALYHQPEVLILDEATSALDNATEAEFMQAIDALHGQKTILMVAHRLSTVRNCDRIVVMAQGKVAGAGSYEELLASNADFQQMARIAIDPIAHRQLDAK